MKPPSRSLAALAGRPHRWRRLAITGCSSRHPRRSPPTRPRRRRSIRRRSRWGLAAAAGATALSSLAAGYAVAKVGTAAVGALAEKPELMARLLIFVGLAEGIAIYGLIVSILILNRLADVALRSSSATKWRRRASGSPARARRVPPAGGEAAALAAARASGAAGADRAADAAARIARASSLRAAVRARARSPWSCRTCGEARCPMSPRACARSSGIEA